MFNFLKSWVLHSKHWFSHTKSQAFYEKALKFQDKKPSFWFAKLGVWKFEFFYLILFSLNSKNLVEKIAQILIEFFKKFLTSLAIVTSEITVVENHKMCTNKVCYKTKINKRRNLFRMNVHTTNKLCPLCFARLLLWLVGELWSRNNRGFLAFRSRPSSSLLSELEFFLSDDLVNDGIYNLPVTPNQTFHALLNCVFVKSCGCCPTRSISALRHLKMCPT